MPPRTTVALVLVTLVSACGAAAPSASDFPEELEGGDKVGVVDLSKILLESERGREIQAQLLEAHRQIESQLADFRADIEALAQEIEAAQAAPAPDREALAGLVAEYQGMMQAAEQAQAQASAQLEQYRAQLTQPLVEEVREICEEIGRDEGYALIMERASLDYFDEAVDLTDRILEAFGRAHGGTDSFARDTLRAYERTVGEAQDDEPSGAAEEPSDATE